MISFFRSTTVQITTSVSGVYTSGQEKLRKALEEEGIVAE